MLRITNVNVPFQDESPLKEIAAKRLKVPPQAVLEVVVVRKAVDARRYKGAPLYFVYVLDVAVEGDEQKILAKLRRDKQVTLKEKPQCMPLTYGGCGLTERPVIVGTGPAGLFAALVLAEHGYKPLVFERGCDVKKRVRDIETFWQSGALEESSNVQFGEGGAGTFSDGKLTTRINDSKMNEVLEVFVAAGAPPEIKYLHKPHIGTDKLRTIVKNMRRRIISLGGEIQFESTVTDLEIKDGQLRALMVNDTQRISCEIVLLGIGHSARDTYAMLCDRQVAMAAKPFAIGVRIEHPQAWIDRAQYGLDAGDPRLGAADYALTYQDRAAGRGAYSFCMCPGGLVVAASSEKNRVVTNGMSNYQRDSEIANSALLVTVGPEDFGEGILGGIEFQRKYEALAFTVAGGDYSAPVQTVGDLLAGKSGSRDFLTKPSYLPGVKAADLSACLPEAVVHTLRNALPHFGRKLRGFDDASAVLTGVETRSSAPCRILRDEAYVSVNTAGLYPIGEGAGYAGGIMSSAIDGYHAAFAVMKKYKL